MSAGAAQLVDESIGESIASGFVRIDMTRVYQVLTTDRSDGASTVMGASGLPSIGSSVLYGTATLWCIGRKPSRVDKGSTAKKWNISTRWTNDASSFLRTSGGIPTTDPVQAAKTVEIEFVETMEPIRDAEYLSVTDGAYHNGTEVYGADDIEWLAASTGPILNSAGDPILAERPTFNRMVTVWRYYRDYPDDLEQYINNINSLEVKVTQEDIQGIRATHTFPAKTLRFGAPRVEPQWQDGKLFFRVGVTLMEDKRTWIHSELDRGQRQRVFVGQNKTDGTTWTAGDLANLDPPVTSDGFALLDIEREGYAPGEPLRLNGYGLPASVDPLSLDLNKSFYVNYKKYPETDFSGIAHLA